MRCKKILRPVIKNKTGHKCNDIVNKTKIGGRNNTMKPKPVTDFKQKWLLVFPLKKKNTFKVKVNEAAAHLIQLFIDWYQ